MYRAGHTYLFIFVPYTSHASFCNLLLLLSSYAHTLLSPRSGPVRHESSPPSLPRQYEYEYQHLLLANHHPSPKSRSILYLALPLPSPKTCGECHKPVQARPQTRLHNTIPDTIRTLLVTMTHNHACREKPGLLWVGTGTLCTVFLHLGIGRSGRGRGGGGGYVACETE